MQRSHTSERIIALACCLALCASASHSSASDKDSDATRQARKPQRVGKQQPSSSVEKPMITGSAIPYESVAAWQAKKNQHTVSVVDRRGIETSGAATLAGVLRRRGTLR